MIDTRTGPSIPRQERARPCDRVLVYLPGSGVATIARAKSWANDIVPALGNRLTDAPRYRIILFNGEPPGSRSGHFEGTTRITDGAPTCAICMDVLIGEPGQRGDDRWGFAPCCRKPFHFNCLSSWTQRSHCNTGIDAPQEESNFNEEVGHGRNSNGMYKVRMETTKQCPACRAPLSHARQLQTE